MNIVLGASGQIGSMLVENLLNDGRKVRAVARDSLKKQALKNRGAEVITADIFDEESLKEAFLGGKTVFLLTPENPECNDFIGDTRTILSNYRNAVVSSGISKIVGLSSMGAQHATEREIWRRHICWSMRLKGSRSNRSLSGRLTISAIGWDIWN